MRAAPVVIVLLLAASPVLAQEGRTAERRTLAGSAYEEFLPEWRSGPANATFGNATLAIPEGARFATDGASWLYVVNASAGLEPPAGGCADPEGNATTGTWVLVPPEHCLWARHPGVACWDFEPCVALGGASHGPYPTDPTPTTTTRWITTTTNPFTPDCRAIQGLRCTPAPAWLAVAAIAGAFAIVSYKSKIR